MCLDSAWPLFERILKWKDGESKHLHKHFFLIPIGHHPATHINDNASLTAVGFAQLGDILWWCYTWWINSAGAFCSILRTIEVPPHELFYASGPSSSISIFLFFSFCLFFPLRAINPLCFIWFLFFPLSASLLIFPLDVKYFCFFVSKILCQAKCRKICAISCPLNTHNFF